MDIEQVAEVPILPFIVRKSGMRFQDQVCPMGDGRSESDEEI
jgi:hypothetical protein